LKFERWIAMPARTKAVAVSGAVARSEREVRVEPANDWGSKKE
jgi:hypothetical protein